MLVCVEAHNGERGDDSVKGYGFDNKQTWFTPSGDWGLQIDDEPVIATDEEVKEALIAEAKKRGFKPGVMVSSTCGNYKNRAKGTWQYDGSFGLGISSSYVVLFAKGEWATIIKEVEMTVAEVEKKLGITNLRIIK